MNENTIKSLLNGLLDEYSSRDSSVPFQEWLSEELAKSMPEVSSDHIAKTSEQIIAGVAEYDKKLEELDKSVENGLTKEEWLSEQLFAECKEMDLQTAGEKISAIKNAIFSSNSELLGDETHLSVEEQEWNQYKLKAELSDIGKQAALSGIATVAKALEGRVNSEIGNAVLTSITENIQDVGVQKAEVKAIVAGAVRVASEKGLKNLLPEDTPTQVICDYAGVAVEAAETVLDVAKGEMSMTEGLDRIGRSSVAAVCRMGAGYLKGLVTTIPAVGPVVTYLLGGLFEHMESPQFFNNVYKVVKEAAIATWEGIKNRSKTVFNSLMGVLQKN